MEIPLFPLRTVLFPGMPLPLQIFEERYKIMTRELLASGGVFGVLLIRHGREAGGNALPFGVGTTARIEQWEEVEGGRFRLTARGQQRFRLTRLLPSRPYPYGEIELIDDAHWEPDETVQARMKAIRACFPEYFRLALSLTGQWARGVALPANPHALANTLVPWLQAEEHAKQRLLEIEPAAERLEYLEWLIQQLLEKTRAQVAERRRQTLHGLGSEN